MTQTIKQKNNYIIVILASIVVLFLPFVAMQFTDEVNWDIIDFIVAAALLISFGCLYLWLTQKVQVKQKVMVGTVLTIIFCLVFAELAVGIFTNIAY